ncbi:retron St85 family effector protein [Phaeobacter inhibens]|uniref:retron St85 family effector protein n=1 Tax=Phaeobacter inhibens TaxID=221822 RepID=UPI0021A2ACE4|nr:retron St85 family effector protein [Phaeobacter inhibens]
MLIQPTLLNDKAQKVQSKVFVCGPGLTSGRVDIRHLARKELEKMQNVTVVYGEEIENEYSYSRKGMDLQTLEARFAHDVDFTLLILESPGSIAELGTFTQLPDLQDRLVVLVPNNFFRAESYIARGPLSLLSKRNPQNVIYFDSSRQTEMLVRVLYPLTFFKYAHHILGQEYLTKTRASRMRRKDIVDYREYISDVRNSFHMAITLIGILVGDHPSYSQLLVLTGLGPAQLNASLNKLFIENKVVKVSAAKYHSVEGFKDALLKPFSTTAISLARAKMLAAA